MRYVRDRTGRFPERPHYEPQELDLMFEDIVSRFLRTHRGAVQFPISTDDLTILIEQDSEDLDPYADLSSYGDGVEGVTEFASGRKPRVRVSQSLSTAQNRENRYRTTLTHEYGHVRLHGYMFATASDRTNLFAAQPKSDVIACKRHTMITAAQSDWLEWQAGYACGAILMPASYLRSIANAYRNPAKVYGPVSADSQHGLALIESIAQAFQVSRDAARVRLCVLRVLGEATAVRSLFD